MPTPRAQLADLLEEIFSSAQSLREFVWRLDQERTLLTSLPENVGLESVAIAVAEGVEKKLLDPELFFSTLEEERRQKAEHIRRVRAALEAVESSEPARSMPEPGRRRLLPAAGIGLGVLLGGVGMALISGSTPPEPAVLREVGLERREVTAGEDLEGWVSLAAPAAASETVLLASEPLGVVSHPASVDIAEGKERAGFRLETDAEGAAVAVRVRATLSDRTREATLSILAPPSEPPGFEVLLEMFPKEMDAYGVERTVYEPDGGLSAEAAASLIQLKQLDWGRPDSGGRGLKVGLELKNAGSEFFELNVHEEHFQLCDDLGKCAELLALSGGTEPGEPMPMHVGATRSVVLMFKARSEWLSKERDASTLQLIVSNVKLINRAVWEARLPATVE